MFKISMRNDVQFTIDKSVFYISFATEEKDSAAFQVVGQTTGQTENGIKKLMSGINKQKQTGTLFPEFNISLMPTKFGNAHLLVALQQNEKVKAKIIVLDLRSFGDEAGLAAYLQTLLRTHSDMKIINAINDRPIEDWWVLCNENVAIPEKFERYIQLGDIN